jgi:hypothetical protein
MDGVRNDESRVVDRELPNFPVQSDFPFALKHEQELMIPVMMLGHPMSAQMLMLVDLNFIQWRIHPYSPQLI